MNTKHDKTYKTILIPKKVDFKLRVLPEIEGSYVTIKVLIHQEDKEIFYV